jgi:hypothetical protein
MKSPTYRGHPAGAGVPTTRQKTALDRITGLSYAKVSTNGKTAL